MNELQNSDERAKAEAVHELALLGQKTAQARSILAGLQKKVIAAKAKFAEHLHINHLVEANQQLVMALLAAQSNGAEHFQDPSFGQYQKMLEANEQLVISVIKAQSSQAKAERGLAQQKSTLAMVAHELRGPLTPLSMIAERMVRLPSNELPRMQALIEAQVQHMARLVEDLLDLSRVNRGKLRLNCVDVDIVQISSAAIETCLPLINSKHLQFSADLPKAVLRVHADPIRLAQVLHNLLSNSAKYTQPEGRIHLSVSVRLDAVRICVKDNGIGISAEVLPHIFEPYVQDIHAVGFNGSGLGIGLAVVRELVEAQGGTVVGKSPGQGQGSEFIVMLPWVREN